MSQHTPGGVILLIALIALVSACGAPATTTAPAVTARPTLGTIELRAVDIGYQPEPIEVPRAGRYTVAFRNDGQQTHDVVFRGGLRLIAEPGQTITGDVDVPEAGLSFLCSYPGHYEAGMTGIITVAGHRPADAATDDHSGPAPSLGVIADPAAPPYTLVDATAPARLTGTVHEITLETIERPMTVATGFVQQVWTFNGTVPGPVIRVRVGDTLRIRLVNPSSSVLPHSIDFHASMVAWNDEMTSITPGAEKVYEWRANYAGVWMYHCGTSPALHHIANGMYGMVIVEPRAGLSPVDRELALVQSEWYLGPQGEPGSLAAAMAAAPAPDLVVFNGVANQYLEHPIPIATGERVRVFVLNAGPSVDSAFHVVGTIFDTVIKEGVALTRDNPQGYGAQAVDLAPAQGAIVEFTMAEDGLYPIVTHAFNLVGRGAIGMFQAGDGDPHR
ncbi:MAG: multicopper oxidase domain-containing protein [Chloroflexi bacterium]|nr:multicopper oxidase domain-containing protein [Chloroflexota bacterium]